MILFINPLNSFLTESKKTVSLVYLGVQLIPTPAENKSLQVSAFYYGKLLSYIQQYLDEVIAKNETQESLVAPSTLEIELPEVAAVESQSREKEPQTVQPASNNTEVEVSELTSTQTEDTEVVEVGETEEDIEDWPISEAKPTPNNSKEVSVDEAIDFQSADAIAILLECQTKLQLMSKKKDIGEELVQKAWDTMTLVQRNYLQLISLRENVTKPMGTLGYQLLYQPTKDAKPRKARLIGFYLHGEKLPLADERSILVDGETEPTICSKAHLRPLKNSTPATEQEIKLLEKLLTESQESEPTAEDMASNTFTGLVSAPKLPTGSETGNLPDSSQLKPNVADITDEPIQLELPEPEPIPGGTIAIGTVYDEPGEIEATTPLLEAVKTELIKINNTLEYKTCKYNPEGSTFLEIYHGDTHLGYFEDDGDCLWDSVAKLKFHGFSEEQLDAISEIELPKP